MPRLQLPPPLRRNSPAACRTLALLGLLTLSGFVVPAWSEDDSSAAGTAAKPVFEEWVIVVLEGKTCGYGSTITTKTDGPNGPEYLTVHQEEFVVKRMGTTMKIVDTSKVTEDAEGGVLSFDQVSQSGASVESSGVRDGDYMVVSSRARPSAFISHASPPSDPKKSGA